MSGWFFVGLGVLLIALGSLSVYYGQDILRRSTQPTPVVESTRATQGPVLTPQQERLLGIIYKYQVQFAARKLVIARDGGLHFDDPERRKAIHINLAVELLGEGKDASARTGEFEAAMETIPTEYLRMIPEARFDNPFVVTVTDAGIRYLNRR